MSDVLSGGIAKVAALLGDGAAEPSANDLREADRLLTATIETIADVLFGATRTELGEWTTKAAEALRRLGRVDEASPTFLAGRLSTIVDLLGYATASTASEEILEVLSLQPHRRVLATVAAGIIAEADIEASVGCGADALEACLVHLQSHSLVVRYSHGTSKVASLTPLGKLVIESAVEYLIDDEMHEDRA